MTDTRKFGFNRAKEPSACVRSPGPLTPSVASPTDKLGDQRNEPRDAVRESEFAIWRLPKVIAAVGLSKSGIHRAIHHDGFPTPIRLGQRAVGWRAVDVLNWLKTRPSAR